MRKVLLVSILSLLCMTTAMAQEPAICGDWIGVFESTKPHPTEDRLIPADWKLYLRIKKIGEDYIVMMKRRLADETIPFVYEKKCKVQFGDEHIIRWITIDEDDWDISSTYKEQGINVGHVHDTVYNSAEYNNGCLSFSSYLERTHYDRQGHVINKKKINTGFPRKCELYKDNADW